MSFESKKHILLVEDDFKLAHVVSEYLESIPAGHVYTEATGYRVSHEPNGALAPQRIIREQPDLVLLDLMLPGMDGIQICRRVREKDADGLPGYSGPIIMLTALSDEGHEITGIDAGADAYLAKPAKPRKLLAYIERFLTEAERRDIELNRALEKNFREMRESTGAIPAKIVCGNLEIRMAGREVWMHGPLAELFCTHCLEEMAGGSPGVDGLIVPLMVTSGDTVIFERKKDRDERRDVREALHAALKTDIPSLSVLIDLTGAEYELLVYLAMRAGKIVGREQIYLDIRKIEWDGMDRSSDLRVTRLRRKLCDDARNPKIIKSVRGEGYLMSPSP